MNQNVLPQLPVKSKTSIVELPYPYKVYVGLDKDRSGKIIHFDIIDGYLNSNEQLELNSIYINEAGITCIDIHIVEAPKMNTYLQVKADRPVHGSILVRVYQSGTCMGYQWIDISGEIKLLPKNDILAISFFKNKA